MNTTRRYLIALTALTLTAGACLAEDPAPPVPIKFYKFDFVIKEADGGKVLNSRAYSLLVSTSSTRNKGEVRAGSKIPYKSSSTDSQYQIVDVGVNIDVLDIKEIQDHLSFYTVVEVSPLPSNPPDPLRPPIRQNRWTSTVVVSLKKPTVLFSSDNVDSKSQMQVEVTATPIP